MKSEDISNRSSEQQGDLPFAAQQRREVFARFGLAMYYAQCLEHQLGIDLASIHNHEFLETPPSDRGVFYDDQFRKTLGRLKYDLMEQGCLPTTLDNRLDEAVKFRNWLAHHYFRKRATEILTTEGREQMIEELQEKADFFAKLDEDFTVIHMNWLLSQGISKEDIESEMAKILPRKNWE